MKRTVTRRRPRHSSGGARCSNDRGRGRERQGAVPLHRPVDGQDVDLRVRHGPERQSPGAPLVARQEPGRDLRHEQPNGLPSLVARDSDQGDDRRPQRRRLRHRQRPGRSWRVLRDGRGDPSRHRRRPRDEPRQAAQASLSLPRHVRLDGRRQGDDRRQGRQPAGAAADDRADLDAVLLRSATRPSSSTGRTASRP